MTIEMHVPITLIDVAQAIEYTPDGYDQEEIMDFLSDVNENMDDVGFSTELVRRMLEGIASRTKPNDSNGELIQLFDGIPIPEIIQLFADILYEQQNRRAKEAQAVLLCKSCDHEVVTHKLGEAGGTPCRMAGCECIKYLRKDEAPCRCGHPWEDHRNNPGLVCTHAMYASECGCGQYWMQTNIR